MPEQPVTPPAPGGPMPPFPPGGPGGPGGGMPPMPQIELPDLDWDHLTLDWEQYRTGWKLSPDGSYYELRFVYYATNVLNRNFQYMNLFVPAAYLHPDGTINPDGQCGGYTAATAPVILKNGCAGWRSSMPGDARQEFLSHGFIHVDVGARSRGCGPEGKAPAPCVDQKAAVRMLRLHDAQIPGDKDRIISCGDSGGGQMSSIIGATGNMAVYYPELYAIGAAGIEKNPDGSFTSSIRDDIYGCMCYCPIADIEHADMAYAWQHCDDPNIRFNDFGSGLGEQTLTPFQLALQQDLAQGWAAYVNTMGLQNAAGEPLTFPQNPDGTYALRSGSYYRQYLQNISDALNAFLAAHTQPDGSLQFSVRRGPVSVREETYPDVQTYLHTLDPAGSWLQQTDSGYAVTDLSGFIQGTGLPRGKSCPGFDTFHYTAENNAFGGPDEDGVHFSVSNGRIMAENLARYQTMEGFADCDVVACIRDAAREDLPRQTWLLNATQILLAAARGDVQAQPAPYWRTRNGTADENTSFCIAYDLCMAARLAGCQADYALIWNAGHGDVDGDGTGSFADWVRSICP